MGFFKDLGFLLTLIDRATYGVPYKAKQKDSQMDRGTEGHDRQCDKNQYECAYMMTATPYLKWPLDITFIAVLHFDGLSEPVIGVAP